MTRENDRYEHWTHLAAWWHARYWEHILAGRQERAAIAKYRHGVALTFAYQTAANIHPRPTVRTWASDLAEDR